MEEGIKDDQTAKYNESSLQLMRLNNIWVNCQTYQREGNLIKLKWEIMNAWIELSSSAKKLDEQRKYYEDKKTWTEKYNELKKNIDKIKSREELFLILIEMQLFLRHLQDKSGKGTKWVDSDEDDIE